ncbi:hypothetical protein [Bordetella sp. LUAb4]|uniref:hypothetical protein n=1 Tax=Bordetella sp. LUAb4 TaxID=2843195 RepID=UPI001E511F96|nr:hypothetical protein [Bordetella sp. LUAb4]
MAEKFRAADAVEVHADLSRASEGAYRDTDSNRLFLKWKRLTAPECLLRMMAYDDEQDDEAITGLLFKSPTLSEANLVLTTEWLKKGTPYGTAEILHSISNYDQHDPAIIARNRAIEENLLNEIEQALKDGKYDYFLFMKEGSSVEYRLVDAADARAGTMTYRSLPAAVYETRAPFSRLSAPGHVGMSDVCEDWVLVGLKRLPKRPPEHLLLNPSSALERGHPRTVNFRAAYPIKVHTNFSDAGVGFHWIPDIDKLFIKSENLSAVECLFRMMVSDSKRDERELRELFHQAPTLGTMPTRADTMKWLQEKNPYAEVELVYDIHNIGIRNRKVISRNRAKEARLVSEITHDLKNKKYDYFLFVRETHDNEFMLIHEADENAGTITYRALPSAVCETRAPFKQVELPNGVLVNQHDNWVLYGLKCLPPAYNRNR